MTYPLTRVAAAATLAYNIVAVTRPQSLVSGLDAQITGDQARLLTRTWFGRDVPISAFTLLASGDAVALAVVLRVAADMTDAAVLGVACHGSARRKAVGVTLGWATTNVAALVADRRKR